MQNYKVVGKLKKTREVSYYSATHKPNDRNVTLQRLHSKKLTWQQLLNRRDVALMKTSKLQCLPKVIEIIKDEGKFFLVLEKLERNLQGVEVEEKEAVEIAWKMLEAAAELESQGVHVGELRPQCFFYDHGKLTIGHFVGDRDTNKFDLTESHDFRYIAPQHVLSSKSPDVSSTVFSIGCILAQMLLRRPLVQAKTKVEYIYALTELFPKQSIGGEKKGKGELKEANSFEVRTRWLGEELQGVLEGLLRINPAERMQVAEAIERLKAVDVTKIGKQKPKKKTSEQRQHHQQTRQHTSKPQLQKPQKHHHQKPSSHSKTKIHLQTTQSKKLPSLSPSKPNLNFLDEDSTTIDRMLDMLKLTKPLRSQQNVEDDVTQAIIIRKSEAPELPMLAAHHTKTQSRSLRRGSGKPQLTNFAMQDGNLGVQLGSSFFSEAEHPPF